MTETTNNDSSDDAIWQAALDWLIREHEESLSEIDREALYAWLAVSPQHRSVFHEAKQLWLLTGVIPLRDERS